MGSKFSHHEPASIRNSLKKIPFSLPTNTDIAIISQMTGIDKHDVKRIFDQHLDKNPDGKLDRKTFCEIYHSLMQRNIEFVDILSKNVFKALGVVNPETEQISLNEFLITFVLTCPGDLRKKLEYVFEKYDVNNENVLEVKEVKEIIEGILYLYNPKEMKDVDEVAKECFKSLKIVEVVRKSDFVNGLMENKHLVDLLASIE